VTNISESFTYKVAAKINWHRCGTKLRQCHPIIFHSMWLLSQNLSTFSWFFSEVVKGTNVRTPLICHWYQTYWIGQINSWLWYSRPTSIWHFVAKFHSATKGMSLFAMDVVVYVKISFFGTLALSVLWRCWLGGSKGVRPVKNWMVRCWHGYLSGARCRLAYGPADAMPNQIKSNQIWL